MDTGLVDLLEADAFPQKTSWEIHREPEPSDTLADGYIDMEFRLIYRGPLQASTTSQTRAREKHQIRKELHLQLQECWKAHPQLRHLLAPGPLQLESVASKIAARFKRDHHTFLPLVREKEDGYCSLNILFLRRDIPGKVVSGGDLDNRLKTLLDALSVPNSTAGMPDAPEPGFDPIYCLLQDDGQITAIHVVTDRILTPIQADEHRDDVVLVIHVHVYRGTNVSQIMGLPGSA